MAQEIHSTCYQYYRASDCHHLWCCRNGMLWLGGHGSRNVGEGLTDLYGGRTIAWR